MPGRDNLVANFLSRMNIAQETISAPIPNDFLDDLFAISTLTPWFADMANYLVTD